MNLKNELELYKHTNRVQAEVISELKEEVRLLQRAVESITKMYDSTREYHDRQYNYMRFQQIKMENIISKRSIPTAETKE